MYKIITAFLLSCLTFLASCEDATEPEVVIEEPEEILPPLVEKSNDTKVYMHYMPWFESKDFSGYWGIHWKMANKNPDNRVGDQREIAAHYYPLIGPYDSGDPDVIDYHLLLMKYAGIDGVLIDWYGSYDVDDYGSNRENSNALIEGISETGLEFAVVYEEFTTEKVATRMFITDVEAAQNDMRYLEENYFSNPRHITIDEQPLLMTFGPRHIRTSSKWTEIFSVLTHQPKFMPLWNHGNYVGSNGNGEFSWVDFETSFSSLKNFYNSSNQRELTMGSAYPGFHDFYAEGSWGASYGYVNHLGGLTMKMSLDKATEYSVDYLQLVTWNDFGEGTMIEPTHEFQYAFLLEIQKFTGVTYGQSELEMIHEYYKKRKEFDGNADKDLILDQVFEKLNELKVQEARELLDQL